MLLPVTVLFHSHCYVTQMKWDPSRNGAKKANQLWFSCLLFAAISPAEEREQACRAHPHRLRSFCLLQSENVAGVHRCLFSPAIVSERSVRGEIKHNNQMSKRPCDACDQHPLHPAGPACLLTQANGRVIFCALNQWQNKMLQSCHCTGFTHDGSASVAACP